jgi:hypothetical protein
MPSLAALSPSSDGSSKNERGSVRLRPGAALSNFVSAHEPVAHCIEGSFSSRPARNEAAAATRYVIWACSERDVVVRRSWFGIVVVRRRKVTATATAPLTRELGLHGSEQHALLVMPTGFGRVVERAATARDVVLEVLHGSASDGRALAASVRREHQPAVAGRRRLTKAARRRGVSDEAYRKLAQAEPEAIASADRGTDANGLGRTIGALNEYGDGKALIVHPRAMTFEGNARQTNTHVR